MTVAALLEAARAKGVMLATAESCTGGMIAAMIMVQVLYKKVDVTMGLNGALAGLVSITAGPATPSLGAAVLIGAVGGVLVVLAVPFFDKLKIDDPVGAISVHGVVGMWGLIAVVLSNPDATIGAQLTGLAAIFIWVFVTSFIVWLIIKAVMGIRVSEEEEYEGVDLGECGLEAYPEFVKT